MVRESTSKPGCYALSLRVPCEFQPSGIAHYLIMRTNKGYKIKVRRVQNLLPFYVFVVITEKYLLYASSINQETFFNYFSDSVFKFV